MRFGALEAGGTKMIVAIGDENGKILERASFPTKTPEETMPQMIDFFKDKEIESLGIACFGPIDLNKDSKTYGYITSTPKLAWKNYDIVGAFKKALNVPVGFDTDVNGSLLGEITWGCAKDKTDALYLTIGTGIGGGVMTNGKLLHGMLHPELGHIRLAKVSGDDYAGKCPYHGTCFEGLAAGPAIEERWGKKAVELADRDEVWELESEYIAQALSSFILTLSPQIIILGGGVMHQMQLFPLIREKVVKQLNGYLNTKELENMDKYIVPASLNDDQGIMGAVKLAIDAKGEIK
ncbi:fructokinase [Butyrivibrio sp. INlla18]|uniref:ROK family protein n=1 Tax=Butyrivibrio sp. INlla18 TaxID=1520806 RepID=UPI00088CC958|nr:ROK family protein [Butyrivibrio sp. INlla18]SDA56980.1 fructokinase [Butyrivibrio sp. INlla18]